MNTNHLQLYVAWQDAVGRGIYPVARLRVEETSSTRRFEFRYIRGARRAERHGFSAFDSFPHMHDVYVSQELFPFFRNRVMQPNRPDFAGYVAELGLSESTADPLLLLARSGGTRATDRIEIYAAPQGNADSCTWHFLLRGVRHLHRTAEERIERLIPGERLYVMQDLQNDFNSRALLIRSEDKINLGYIPDLLVDGLGSLEFTRDQPVVTVSRVNPSPAPVQHRVLCELRAQWPAGQHPFSAEQYEPLDG